jgi:hypothetical protein
MGEGEGEEEEEVEEECIKNCWRKRRIMKRMKEAFPDTQDAKDSKCTCKRFSKQWISELI